MRAVSSKAPHCMSCGCYNGGNFAGCHLDGLTRGKGMGQKSHDVLAYLCQECHDMLDARTGTLTPFERDVMGLRAVYDSMVWLMSAGDQTLLNRYLRSIN